MYLKCPAITRSGIVLAWISVMALGAWLRLAGLDEAPIHADEATGAWILAERIEGEGYHFDPVHFHGPLLTAIASPIAKLRGETSWESLEVETLRVGPAIAGLLCILTPLLWRRHFGQAGALFSATLMATSPLLVYYNRVFIHESWLTLFALLSCAFLYRLIEAPRQRDAVLAGLSLGLMFATKETTVIYLFTWFVALSIHYSFKREKDPKTVLLPALLIAGSTTFLTVILIYTNGFRDFQPLLHFFETFSAYELTAGHEQPIYHYAERLFLPKAALGILWSEGLVLVLLLAALIRAPSFSPMGKAGIVYLSVSGVLSFTIHSLIGYKTPWLMLVPMAHLCLLAGFCCGCVERRSTTVRAATLALFATTIFFQTYQTYYATQRYANDPRNPYAYVPTSQNMEGLPKWLHALTQVRGERLKAIIVGTEFWPLPWYLRGTTDWEHQPQFDATTLNHDLIFVPLSAIADEDEHLQDTHVPFLRSLRANVPIFLYIRKDLWRAYENATAP